MSGKLITIEGIDGSGKTSLVRYLGEYYTHQRYVFTVEPTHSWIGMDVRRAIASDVNPLAELFLFMADHAQHIDSVIRPAILAGKIVISDRYSDSRCAYQGMTLKSIKADAFDWVEDLHTGWTVVPDLTILLDVDVDVALSRCGNRDAMTKFEKRDFLNGVAENYRTLAKRHPGRFAVVDASMSFEDVVKTVVGLIDMIANSR